jgi:hypothetical protein
MKEKAMKENADNKLSYQGDDADGNSVYHMLINGKVVFQARVNKDEAGMPIYVSWPTDHVNNLHGWFKTTHRAFTVEDGSRVSAMTMKEAVYINLPLILLNLMYDHN